MLALIVLLLVLALFGAGFALKALWIVAIIALIFWAVGFMARSADGHWYRW